MRKNVVTLDFIKARCTVTPSGCWEWNMCRIPDGYGMVAYQGHARLVHRLSFILNGGNLPAGYKVLHRCDNPPCCNPEHLFGGTQKDNMDDMFAKGRGNPPCGIRQHRAKIDEAAVIAIRADTRQQKDIAASYGLDQTTVSNIKIRKTWKHVA